MSVARPLPSIERLRELIDYDPSTGSLTWKPAAVRPRGTGRNRVAGASATYKQQHGYLKVYIDRRAYPAHRVAFALANGREPVAEIDHIDGNPANNAGTNLREATRQQNCRNVSGWGRYGKGVAKNQNRFQARIHVNRRFMNLGSFATPEEARAAYAAASVRYFPEFGTVRHRLEREAHALRVVDRAGAAPVGDGPSPNGEGRDG